MNQIIFLTVFEGFEAI